MMTNTTAIETGTRVTAVVNFTTRVGSVVKIQKNGKIVVLADEVRNAAGRRLYAAQRFTLPVSALVVL